MMDEYIKKDTAIVKAVKCINNFDPIAYDIKEAIKAIPAADVVTRDCYDRILWENDIMRQQLAEIGKAFAKKMDDVRPVVRAHWTDHRTIEHDGEWYCSNCGNEVTICMCGKDKTPSYPFCPNCGADMRQEHDG